MRRVRLKSIIRSKPSADPAAACCCCGRRIFRASHRHVRRIVCARRRRLFAAEPFADATRTVRWRLMSRQALHSTRPNRNLQRRKSRFHGEFALRHALFQLVAACIFRCMAILLIGHSSPTKGAAFSPRCEGFAESIRKPDHSRRAVRTGRAVRCHRMARMQHEPCDTRARSPVTSRWLRARCPSCAAP